jgi:hypothetical protein
MGDKSLKVDPSLLEGSGARVESIAVADKIIADISTGIYRTPAAALKELVSNAYDADATRVMINTGSPNFDEMSIFDNGSGMTIGRFVEIIHHIGGSWKRLTNADGVSPQYKRPLIGRIGIGMLAVAQLGQRFYVSSTVAGEPYRFLAEVDLEAFHSDEAARRSMNEGEDKTIDIGSIRYIDRIPEELNSHFTVITVPNPKRGILSEMRSQLRKALDAEPAFTYNEPAEDFSEMVRAVQDSKRADVVLDGYHYLL